MRIKTLYKTKKIALLGAVLCVLASALSAQQKYALVIGNGAYTNITRLNNPANDARDMGCSPAVKII